MHFGPTLVWCFVVSNEVLCAGAAFATLPPLLERLCVPCLVACALFHLHRHRHMTCLLFPPVSTLTYLMAQKT